MNFKQIFISTTSIIIVTLIILLILTSAFHFPMFVIPMLLFITLIFVYLMIICYCKRCGHRFARQISSENAISFASNPSLNQTIYIISNQNQNCQMSAPSEMHSYELPPSYQMIKDKLPSYKDVMDNSSSHQIINQNY